MLHLRIVSGPEGSSTKYVETCVLCLYKIQLGLIKASIAFSSIFLMVLIILSEFDQWDQAQQITSKGS